ncbi:hypothetical protein FHU38_001353 [Saccharomonospora amisosensis]|uniref:Uncharacterized protein n=1 Tax=Saccharomonospora amisosensis TaxID=1128677 RepID=A0A7X5UNR1_9PSEU|nr:hypothetical protein [Saccharomonospora amisosensis]NIJ11009.1 hypothetical protein [Saccharomonospora amisosensis]
MWDADRVRAVVAGLARIVAADGGRLVLRSYDARRRELAVELTGGPGPDNVDGSAGRPGCPVDERLVADFLTEALCRHGIDLAEIRVESRLDRNGA